MKKIIINVVLALSLIFPVSFLNFIPSLVLADTRTYPTCSISYTKDFNLVTYTIEWSYGDVTFDFNDGSSIAFGSQNGNQTFTHGYSYTENGIVTYHPVLTVHTPEGNVSCSSTVEIIHNPRVPVDPACGIEYSQNFNQLSFAVNSSDGPATFDFGDGAVTSVANGQQTLTHSYAYTQNGTVSYTPILSIQGPDGVKTCSSHPVTITHNPRVPVDPACGIEYSQNFNQLSFAVNSSDGPATFDFGDGAVTSVANGQQTLTHSYAYTQNGTVSYMPILRVQGPDGQKTCSPHPVTITHNPPAPVEPVCSIVYNQDQNVVDFTVEWSDGAALFDFNDGTNYGLPGNEGTQTFAHSYSFNMGGTATYLPSLNIQGPNGLVTCDTTVNIVN